METRIYSQKILTIFVIGLLLCSFNSHVFAQQDEYKNINGVQFKDGTVVMGTILKLNDDQVVIKRSDNQIVIRQFNEIDKFVMSGADGSRSESSVAPRIADAQPSVAQSPDKEHPAQAIASGRSTETTAPGTRRIRWFASAGGGGFGDAKAANVHLEGGGYTIDQTVNFLFVFGGALTINRDDTPANLREDPCPNPYRSLGTKKKGEEAGLYSKLGIEPIKNSGFFIFAKGGFTTGTEIELTQSTVTEKYYQQSSTRTTYGLYGGGIGYFPKGGRLNFQIEYDNRMGVSGNIGYGW